MFVLSVAAYLSDNTPAFALYPPNGISDFVHHLRRGSRMHNELFLEYFELIRHNLIQLDQ